MYTKVIDMPPQEARINELEKENRRLKRYVLECRATHRMAAMTMAALSIKNTPLLHADEEEKDQFTRRMWSAFAHYEEETLIQVGEFDFAVD